MPLAEVEVERIFVNDRTTQFGT